MANEEGVLTREVTRQECKWLDEDLPKGKKVFRYTQNTYGIIPPSGVAVTDEIDKDPFYQIPRNAVSWGK